MEPPVPVYFYLLKDSQDSAPLLKLSKLPHPPPATTLLSCFSSSRAIYCLKLFPHHLLSQFTSQKHTTSLCKLLLAGPHAKELCLHAQLPQHLPAPSGVPQPWHSLCQWGAQHWAKHMHIQPKGWAQRSPQHPAVTYGFPANSTWTRGCTAPSWTFRAAPDCSKAYTDTGRTLLKPYRSKIRSLQFNPVAKKM